MTNNFQVNLSGLVEVLSRNLYSGPKVFVRELLQNGFDAITARRKLDPTALGEIRFHSDGLTKLTVTDSGVGLTLEQTKELLASIGSTSKRDELGMARTEYIGQFGIGLLSCFMVTQTIVVYSQSALSENAAVVRWRGNGDGTWDVTELATAEIPLDFHGPGTMIVLEAQGAEPLFARSTIENLVNEYGAHLPVSIVVSDTQSETLLGAAPFPWEQSKLAQDKWCSQNFGFHPFERIILDLPDSETKGLAFVLPAGAHPGQTLKHHVYVHNMLVSKTVTNLVPEWAYFVRVVVDSAQLKPTASRESLFDDEFLESVREEIGKKVREWLGKLAAQDYDLFVKFMQTHMVGMKALAVHDQPTRNLVLETIPFETTLGFKTLAEIISLENRIIYSRSTDDYRAVAAVANAQDLLIVNGGYAFDEQLFAQIKLDTPSLQVREVKIAEILGALKPLDFTEEINYLTFLEYASQALETQKVEVVIRSFSPASLPMLYLPQPGGAGKEIESNAANSATGAFAGLIESLSLATSEPARDQVVFNSQVLVINQLANLADADMIKLAVRGFFVQAILSGHHTATPEVKQWSTQVFLELINRSISGYN